MKEGDVCVDVGGKSDDAAIRMMSSQSTFGRIDGGTSSAGDVCYKSMW